MRMWVMAATATAALASGAARAEVQGASPSGFTAVETAHIAAPPGQVWALMIQPARWWSSEHSYSGDAANYSLDVRPGGCWCEKLPGGGFAQHLQVIYAVPAKTLRLTGALGPLQPMPVQGVLTFNLAPASGGTDLKVTYALAGPGLAELSGPVDNVLGQQVARLKAAVESGR